MSSLPTPGQAGFWARARSLVTDDVAALVWEATRLLVGAGIAVALFYLARVWLVPGTGADVATAYALLMALALVAWVIAAFRNPAVALVHLGISMAAGMAAGAATRFAWAVATIPDFTLDARLDESLLPPAATAVSWLVVWAVTPVVLLVASLRILNRAAAPRRAAAPVGVARRVARPDSASGSLR